MATRTSIIGLHKPAYNDNADISVINQDMDMIDAALGKAEGISAPIYDPTATYVVDSYCTYNMDMYRCTTAITTPEDWNASHWTKTTIVGEFGNIKPSGGGVFRDITVTIDPEDWTFNSTTNQYEYTWVNAYVTQTAGISVAYRDRTVRRYLVSDVDFEKVNGGVEFMTDNIPTDTIRFTVRIIDASIDGVFPISAELISTSAVTGVDNVEDALAIVGDACSYRSITIATSDWSVTSPYTYEYEWNKITADCSVEIIPESGAENSGIEDFDITVLSGKVRITTIYEPAGSFPVTIKVLNAVTRRVQQITGADVATDVITGSSNVNEALNSLSSKMKVCIDTTNVLFPVGIAPSSYTATEDCYFQYIIGDLNDFPVYVNNVKVSVHGVTGSIGMTTASGFLKTGDVLTSGNVAGSQFVVFGLK